MIRKRIALIVAMLLILLPTALIAQENDPEVAFPIAVVALEGSYEVADNNATCELAWESAGTPTLRVTASGDARFRQNLVEGELVTIPEVDDALACRFVVEVALPESRRYEVTIEGMEIVELASADLADLEGAVVLPVAMDRAGRYELVTDDYLDLELDDVTGSLLPVVPEEPEPAGTPDAGSTIPTGQYEVVGRLNLWTSGPEDAPFGCAASPTRTGVYPGAQVVVRDGGGQVIGYGTLIYSDRSGSTVCSFDFTVVAPESDFYVFELGNGHRQVASFAELELWNWHVFIDTGSP